MRLDELVSEIETLRSLVNRRNDRNELNHRLMALKRRVLTEGVTDAEAPVSFVRSGA